MAEWILIITLGTCCGVLLSIVVQEVLAYIKGKVLQINIKKIIKKLRPKRPSEEEKRLRKELDTLLKRKPAKAKGPQALGYFSGLLKKQNPQATDLVIRQVVQNTLEK